MGQLNGSIGQVNVNSMEYGKEALDQQMTQFLGLENTDLITISRKGISLQDREALGKLKSSVHLVYGHYKVGMLRKHKNPLLPKNRKAAVAKLCSLR